MLFGTRFALRKVASARRRTGGTIRDGGGVDTSAVQASVSDGYRGSGRLLVKNPGGGASSQMFPNLKQLPSPHSPTFAIRQSSLIYHLLYPDNGYTLCGFRAEKLDVQHPDIPELHVVESVPASRNLCKQCGKMDQRRKRAPLDQATK